MNTASILFVALGLWLTFPQVRAEGAPPGSTQWPLKVKLKRVYASAVKADGNQPKVLPSFYVGRLSLGGGEHTQDMLVSFDTSSGNVIIPGTLCKTASCRVHRRYSARDSQTAEDINTTGYPLMPTADDREQVMVGLSSMEFGDGRLISLPMRETMCLWSGGAVTGRRTRACLEQGVLVAASVMDYPFLAFPHDGIVGMGLHGLSINPLFSFLEQFFAQSDGREVASQFGLFYGERGGELSLGGYDATRVRASEPLQWVPVAVPEDGYWQVRIIDLRIGNQTFGRCKEGLCFGIVDTSASSMGVPSSMLSAVKETLAQGATSSSPGVAGLCAGPSMVFTLQGGVQLTLDPATYMAGYPECFPQVSALELPEHFGAGDTHLFVLGEPFLRRFYSVFDWAEQRIGFGMAAEETAEDSWAEKEVDLPVAADMAKMSKNSASGQDSADHQRGDETRAGLLSFFLLRLIAFALLLSCGGLAYPWLEIKGVILGRPMVAEALSLIERVPAGTVPDGDECAICLGSCEEAACKETSCDGCLKWCRLQCGHQFHEDCILQWLRRASQCPVCRRQIWPSAAKV